MMTVPFYQERKLSGGSKKREPMYLPKLTLVLIVLLLPGFCLAGMALLYLAMPAEIATVALWYVGMLKEAADLLSPSFWLLAFCLTSLWLWYVPQLWHQKASMS